MASEQPPTETENKKSSSNSPVASIDDPSLWTTKQFFSALDSVLSEKTPDIDRGAFPDDDIPPDLKSLVLELQQGGSQSASDGVHYEQLEPLLVRLMKHCYKAKDVTLQVSNYLHTHKDVLRNLSSLAKSILKDQVISYKGVSFLTLFYEWFRVLTESSSTLAVKAADAGFVVNVLYCLDVLVTTAQHNEMFRLLLMVLLGFIQNLATESACWPYFEQTRFVDILAVHAKTVDKANRFMSLYVLSLLAEIIPLHKQSVLVFDEDTIKEYVGILTTAVSAPNLQATKVYGSLVIPADDFLRLLKQIWHVESNRSKIASFIPSLVVPIETCLQKGDQIQQKAAVDLLWTLASDSDLLSQVNAGSLSVNVQLLERLANSSTDSSDSVHTMATCVLRKLHPKSLKNEDSILEVVKGTYTFKRYAECIEICHQILPAKVEPKSPKEFATLLYKGKAFCRLYQREQKRFQEASSSLSKKDFYLQQSSIYEKAGEAINSLGFLFDTKSSSLDGEMLSCLDVSMIDIACQMNTLKEYSRCLLCLNRAKLRRSHMCPDSILDAFAKGLEKTKNKKIYNLTFFEEGKTISPHGVARWLFCGKCENILSRDGETHFIPKFFRHLYSTESPQQLENGHVIPYDQWLYRFVIGFLFRGLINEAFSSFLNSDVIHNTFVRLRQLLCFEGALSDLPHNPDIYLLVSPSVPNVSAGFIGHVYHAPFLFALTDKDLLTGSSTLPRTCQFFLARIGIMNFLLLFDDSLKDLLPPEAKISASHGEFTVPPEAERSSFIPSGIDEILNDLGIATQRNLLESTISTAKALKLSDDAKPPPSQETAAYMTHDAIGSDVAKLKETLLTGQPSNHPQKLDFLPPGFRVEHSSGLVTLPDGHQVLFHGDFEIEADKNEIFHITLFLAAGNDSSSMFSLEKPYVIFHRYQPAGLEVTFGFFVNPDNLSATSFISDPNTKVMRNRIGEQLRVKAYTDILLPELMKRRGLRSYFTVVHRALLLKHTITYDHVCGELCWYCELRCNTCLSQAPPNLSGKTQDGRTQRFCSEACQRVYCSSTTKEDVVLDVFDSQLKHLLLLSFDVTLPRKAGGYTRADISVYVCNEDSESGTFPSRSLYVVYHHSTAVEQHFLEFFIHDDCSFSHMLHYYGSREYPEMKYAVDFAKHLITEKLEDLGTTLRTLVDFALANK